MQKNCYKIPDGRGLKQRNSHLSNYIHVQNRSKITHQPFIKMPVNPADTTTFTCENKISKTTAIHDRYAFTGLYMKATFSGVAYFNCENFLHGVIMQQKS